MRKAAQDRDLKAIYGGPKGRTSPHLAAGDVWMPVVGVSIYRGLFTPEYTPVDIMEFALSFRFFMEKEARPAWMNQEFRRKIL